ncbi:hypothetical protein CK203_040313 [Vitis vinifera]|uniref:GH16 domain-containing protein n=1 Tax=Vitis vinifera TaxID=29760 RepID=A0A438FX64_VITVI|nr:hypothetical protein CK203_040313 [Vitis vinifera]
MRLMLPGSNSTGRVVTTFYERGSRGFKPWFDPTPGFHSYKILWNTHQIA